MVKFLSFLLRQNIVNNHIDMQSNFLYTDKNNFLKKVYDNRYVCNCGHVIYFRYNIDKIVCKCCGKVAYKNNQARFRDKLLKAIKQNTQKR